MFKRTLIVLCLFVLLLPAVAYAQQPPQAVLDALAALNQKLGTNLALSDMASWAWSQKNFPDISLGCPFAGQSYSPVVTSGYIVNLTYNGVAYDFRVSVDRKIVFLCSPGGGAPGGTGAVTGATPIPSPTPNTLPVVPVNPVGVSGLGTVVCPGGQIARLAVGMQGQAITTGSVNIRATPGATGQVAGLLLPNGIFAVTGGPQCAGNQTWWQISYRTQAGAVTNGWVMEGDAASNDYWLQPYGAVTPPPAVTPATRITNTNASLVHAITQTPLPEPVYRAALTLEVAPNALIVVGGHQLKFYGGGTLAPLLTLGSSLMESVAVAPLGSGSYLVAATESVPANPAVMNLWIWTLAPGPAAPTMTAQYGVMVPTVNILTFSPDGKRLAAGTGRLPTGDPAVQNGVWIWDTTTNTQIAGIPFAAPVAGLAFSPDGTVLAVATTDNLLHLWSLATNAELVVPLSSPVNTTPDVKPLAFSPNGTQLAVIGSDWAVRLWDMTTKTLRFTLAATPGQYPRQMAYSPDSALLALGGDTSTFTAFVALWDAASGIQLTHQPGSDAGVIALSFNLDGTQIVTVGAQQWGVWGVQ